MLVDVARALVYASVPTVTCACGRDTQRREPVDGMCDQCRIGVELIGSRNEVALTRLLYGAYADELLEWENDDEADCEASRVEQVGAA